MYIYHTALVKALLLLKWRSCLVLMQKIVGRLSVTLIPSRGYAPLWPMTLTYELDLDIFPLDLHAKIQVCMSIHSAGIARRTDTRCQNYYTHHVRDVGCKNFDVISRLCASDIPTENSDNISDITIHIITGSPRCTHYCKNLPKQQYIPIKGPFNKFNVS